MTPEAVGTAELRVVETMPTEYAVAADGTTPAWGPALDTRLRLGGGVVVGDLRGQIEGDVLSGQLVGQRWALASIDERGRDANDALSVAGVVPRTLRAGGRTPWFDLEAGLGTSGWGLGMVANDGATEPLFGRTDFGDRAVRVRIATAPFAGTGPDGRLPLYLVVAGDVVVADDTARWSEGDRALQGVAAVLWHPDAEQAGIYGVVRRQTALDGAVTSVGVVDATADVTHGDLRIAAEAAFVAGRTAVARTYAAPDGVAVRQGGLAVRTSYAAGPLTAHLRGALASGDSAADDARATDFRFDRDYDVGMVLFDEVQSSVDLAAYALATDPSLAELPPEGVETLAAEGAFHQAVAVQPAAEVAPMPWLSLRAGLVLAWSTAPIAQPYYTFRNGGVPTNAMDRTSDGRFLGSEVDWAIATREAAVEDWKLRPSAALQVGHAFPSVGYLGDVGRVDHVLLTAFLRI